MTWIVTGGAGYIGAHVVHRLHAAGRPVVVFDDLSTGRADRLPAGVELVHGSVTDPAALERLFAGRPVQGVIHLAALKSVAESVSAPGRYRLHNVEGVRNLLGAMRTAGVRRLLFSSSAAVYGASATAVDETSPATPATVYGSTKLLGERLIHAAAGDGGIRSLVLRQFNVIGAGTHPFAGDGGATNLLPAVFRALTGAAGRVVVMGGDYPTRDGTAERDYVDVDDVAEAYVLGVGHLLADGPEPQVVVNIGTGRGHTVSEVLATAAAVTGRPVPFVRAGPRPGDPPSVVAATGRAAARLGWRAQRDLEIAVKSAWLGGRYGTGDAVSGRW